MRIVVAVLLLVLAVTGSGFAAVSQGFSDRDLIDGFMRTVFGSENFWISGAAKNRVSKFSGPVRVHITDHANSHGSPDVRRFIADINRRVPRLSISTTRSQSSANYEVYLVRRADYKDFIRETLPNVRTAFLERAACSGIAFLKPDGAISRAMAFVVADEGKYMFHHCMVEEILQGLGPSNDSPRLVHSIFNDRATTDQFTPFDRYILNMLYDPRVQPGMTRQQVMKVLPDVLKDVKKHGV